MPAERIQLLRLISEAYAVLTPAQIDEMGSSMDLPPDDVIELLNDAEAEWETNKPPHARDRQDMMLDLDNQGCEPGNVMIEARGIGARAWAEWDQSINGCKWSGEDGDEYAYALSVDDPKLVDRLEAAGYNLNLADYVPPADKE